VYLLLGIVLWSYFIEVTTNGLSAIVGHGDLMRKLYFPRYVIVIAGSFSALINLAINLIVVSIFMAISGVSLSWHILWVIPLIIELFVFALSIAFLLSALYVKFRDINYIWEVVLQAGFYATPIIYPLSIVLTISPLAAKIMLLNPLAQIIQDMRAAVVSADTATITSVFGNSYMHVVPIIIIVLFAIISMLYFKKKSPGFAEDI
jgi:ABC-2 type transport system permease protein